MAASHIFEKEKDLTHLSLIGVSSAYLFDESMLESIEILKYSEPL